MSIFLYKQFEYNSVCMINACPLSMQILITGQIIYDQDRAGQDVQTKTIIKNTKLTS